MRSRQKRNTNPDTTIEHFPDLYLQLLDNLPQNMYMTDTKGRIVFANKCYCRTLGAKRSSLIGKTVFDLFPRNLARKYAADDRKVLRKRVVLDIVETNQPRYQAPVQVRVIKVPIFNEKKEIVGVQGIWWDITGQQTSIGKMAEQSYFLNALMENLPDNVYFKDTKSRFLLVSKTMAKHLGASTPEEVVGKTDFDFFTDEHAEPAFRDEQRIIRSGRPIIDLEEKDSHADGRLHWVSTTKVPLRNQAGRIIGTFGLSRDITDRKRAEDLLHRRAFYDPLTELPNRALFMDRLRHLFRQRQRSRHLGFAVLFLDLDGFKQINDTLGHEAGDEVLISVARCLENCVRPGDTVARLGGDEFTILLEGTRDNLSAERVARRILKSMAKTTQLKAHSARVTVSIGVAHISHGAQTPDELLRDADAAMYSAKFKGKSQFQTFNKLQHEHNEVVMKAESRLREALEKSELRLVYQPIVDASKKCIVGVEALLRWQHPRRGLLNPDQFMEQFHASSVMGDIGAWALEQATEQVGKWRVRYPVAKNLLMGINVSGNQLPVANEQGFYFAKPLPPLQMERILRLRQLPRANLNTAANR